MRLLITCCIFSFFYMTSNQGCIASPKLESLVISKSNSEPSRSEFKYLTPVSFSAADLLPLTYLQSQGSVSEDQQKKPFKLPPPFLGQPSVPSQTDGQLRKPEVVRPKERQKSKRTNVQLRLRSLIVTNSDIAATAPKEDTAFFNSVTLVTKPKLGPKTNLVADLGGNFVRFAKADGYNALNSQLGLRQRLNKEMYGQLVWFRRELSEVDSSDDLVESSIRLSLSRQDKISGSSANKLTFNSGYNFWVIFAEPKPDNRNRLSHRLRLGFNYDITSKLQGGLNYRLILDDYTRSNRFDTRQQITASTTYKFNRDIFLSSSVSYLFGAFTNQLDSPDSRDFNGVSFRVNLGVNVPLF